MPSWRSCLYISLSIFPQLFPFRFLFRSHVQVTRPAHASPFFSSRAGALKDWCAWWTVETSHLLNHSDRLVLEFNHFRHTLRFSQTLLKQCSLNTRRFFCFLHVEFSFQTASLLPFCPESVEVRSSGSISNCSEVSCGVRSCPKILARFVVVVDVGHRWSSSRNLSTLSLFVHQPLDDLNNDC